MTAKINTKVVHLFCLFGSSVSLHLYWFSICSVGCCQDWNLQNIDHCRWTESVSGTFSLSSPAVLTLSSWMSLASSMKSSPSGLAKTASDCYFQDSDWSEDVNSSSDWSMDGNCDSGSESWYHLKHKSFGQKNALNVFPSSSKVNFLNSEQVLEMNFLQ